MSTGSIAIDAKTMSVRTHLFFGWFFGAREFHRMVAVCGAVRLGPQRQDRANRPIGMSPKTSHALVD